MLSISRALALLGFFLFFSATNANAQIVGSMNVVNGRVSIWPVGSGPRAATPGGTVSEGDLLETGDGDVLIRFHDGANMFLGPSSRMRIDVYRDGEGATSSTVFSLMSGFLRSLTGAIGQARPAAFQLNTPTATIGIRGTDFLAQEKAGLSLGVVSGVVEVRNEHQTSLVAAGQQVAVPNRSALHRLNTSFDSNMRGLLNKSPRFDSSRAKSADDSRSKSGSDDSGQSEGEGADDSGGSGEAGGSGGSDSSGGSGGSGGKDGSGGSGGKDGSGK